MPKSLGIRHVALRVNRLGACINFYTKVIGMTLELETQQYAYLTTGTDNLSLHEESLINFSDDQRLEHFGFSCESPEDVDEWYQHCKKLGAAIHSPPATYGIGTRGFIVFDPSGNQLEFTYHPPMLDKILP